MRAAIYTRSNEQQTKSEVLECRRAVKQCHATLVEVFSDKPGSRHEFERLRACVEGGELDVVVCLSVAALVGWQDVVELVRDWHARGVRVLYDGCDTSEELDLTGAIGALIGDQRLMHAAHDQRGDDPEFERALAARAQRG